MLESIKLSKTDLASLPPPTSPDMGLQVKIQNIVRMNVVCEYYRLGHASHGRVESTVLIDKILNKISTALFLWISF